MTAVESSLVELSSIRKRFGGLQAVNDVSLKIERATVHALIGPNGAGKTTLFNLINGVTKPTSGQILFEGKDVTDWSVHRRAAVGIARTFQTPQLFDEMSVLESVMCGCHLRGNLGPLGSMFRWSAKRTEEDLIQQQAKQLLARVGLSAQSEMLSKNLSYGHRRVLEVARALGTQPKLLLLDEVAAGLNATETARIAELIDSLVAEGTAVLLVEHDMHFVMGISDRVTVLNFGSVLVEGRPADVSSDPRVIEAYIGTWEDD